MKYLLLSFLFPLLFIQESKMKKDIYSIAIKDIEGNIMDLGTYKGKKLLIVNVASECGFTKQYEDLQKLYDEHGDQINILGVPCNDFGGQEPGTEKEIQKFCTMTFGVTFPMTEKVGIKQNRHPLYDWLCSKEKNGVSENTVGWNFHKFLIDEKGNLIKSLPSSVTPMDDQILSWINP